MTDPQTLLPARRGRLVLISLYDAEGDPVADRDLADQVAGQLAGFITGAYGTFPRDVDRGDPGWHADILDQIEPGSYIDTAHGLQIIIEEDPA